MDVQEGCVRVPLGAGVQLDETQSARERQLWRNRVDQ
jgi:hypothetical protein